MSRRTSGKRTGAAARTRWGEFRRMRASPASSPEGVRPPRRFVTTRWSLVLAAGRDGTPLAREALEKLCGLYWSPLYDFVRRQGLPADKARDLTQGFFARMLEKKDLAIADPSRGRFRAWLLMCIKHYLLNEWDREQAIKRPDSRLQVNFDEAERHFSAGLASKLTPERVFVRSWAEKLLQHVLSVLGDNYVRAGKARLFDSLKMTLTGEKGASYARIAEALGKTEAAVKIEASRLRKRYQELLYQEISHTVESPKDILDELRFLLSAFQDP
jgi:RNA polymerase sigma factor (sigma-70 family)